MNQTMGLNERLTLKGEIMTTYQEKIIQLKEEIENTVVALNFERRQLNMHINSFTTTGSLKSPLNKTKSTEKIKESAKYIVKLSKKNKPCAT